MSKKIVIGSSMKFHSLEDRDVALTIKENPEKWLSPTINGGDFRHFSNHGFSKIKSSEINCSIHP